MWAAFENKNMPANKKGVNNKPAKKTLKKASPNGNIPGRFGPYGGRYVPETLMAALEGLEQAYAEPQQAWITDVGILFGFAVVLIGFFLLVLIVIGQFFY